MYPGNTLFHRAGIYIQKKVPPTILDSLYIFESTFKAQKEKIGINNLYSGTFKSIVFPKNINFHFALIHLKSLYLASNNGLYCLDSNLNIQHIYKEKIESLGISLNEDKLWLIANKNIIQVCLFIV